MVIPQCFWDDVFWDDVLSACYVFNRMSSSILENIRHSILFAHEPLHPLSLKVFGSTCFFHNFCPSLDKFLSVTQMCLSRIR